jgi:vacuolar protein sorting-associated protein 13A/C
MDFTHQWVNGCCNRYILGAQQDGVEGFFKGIGKGLMGLMTKPAGGVLDAIAMALDGIKR